MIIPILRLVVSVSLFGAAGVATAQEDSPWGRYSINFGAFYSESDAELRFDSDNLGVGTTLDPEQTLGMNTDDSTYRIDGFWRFGSTRRHQLEVHYFNVDNQGSRTLGQNTRIGDVLFPDGVAVNSQLDLELINVDYSYAFFQDDRIRLAAAIGVHTTALDFNVDAPRLNLAETETFTAPLPVLGLRGDFIITPQWRFRASADVLYVPIGDFDYSVTDSLLAVEYLPFETVGVGLGVNNVRYTVESASEGAALGVDGKARLEFVGALAYLTLQF
jgi:hypothetical protein